MSSGKPHGRRRTARGHSSPPLSLQFVERPIYPATRSSVIPLWSGRGRQGTPAGLEALPQCRDRVQSSRIGVLEPGGDRHLPRVLLDSLEKRRGRRPAGAERRFSARSSGVVRSFDWEPIDRAVPSPCATGALHVDRRLRHRGRGLRPSEYHRCSPDVQRSPRFTAPGTADGHSCERWAGVRAVGRRMVTQRIVECRKLDRFARPPCTRTGSSRMDLTID
jgi:hypothetical protein